MDYKNTDTDTHALIDASRADIRRDNIDRVCSNNNILCLHLEDFCNGTSVLVLTLYKELLIVGSNSNQACLIQRTRPVVQNDRLVFQNGDLGCVLKTRVCRNTTNLLLLTISRT